MVLNRYCKTCESFFRELRAYSVPCAEKYIPFHNIQALIEAATGGCHFCSLLLAEIEERDV